MAEIISILILALIGLLFLFWRWKSSTVKKGLANAPFPATWKEILDNKVQFYKNLSPERKQAFQSKLQLFLSEVKINGVDCEIDDTVKLLVASSAVIPVFNFDNWAYINLSEVLVYDRLVETYQIEEEDNKNRVLGQVRPFQNRHLLLLSKQSLVEGFDKTNDSQNVGFHEFVHLVDGADGEIDGLPKVFMSNEIIKPWCHLMYKEIERIKKGASDINPYGITSQAEFLAVVSEYYLENPEKFKKKHEELYLLLTRIFKKT